jgi:hypothetical protein
MAATTAVDRPPEPPAPRLATEDYVDKRIAELEARLYRAMLIQAGVVVAAVLAGVRWMAGA